VPVVASGTFVRPLEQQAAFIQRMSDTGVQAVTLIASQMAEQDEDGSVWCGQVERLLELTGDIPLALYECPEPYHRLVAPEMVAWAAQTERFFLLKETSRSLEAVRAKIEAASGTAMGIYNADTTALLPSLQAGARGYCGIAANFYPELVEWLCAHYADSPQEAERVQALMSMIDPVIHQKYPVCAKYLRQRAGFDMLTISRTSDAELNAYDRRVFDGIALQTGHQFALLG
jgi:4-hydroxy-tetrahydrodipicolinate synthase